MTLLLLMSGPGTASTGPVNTALPVISGTTQVGSTLTTTNGTWTGSPASYAYQWKRAGTNISGATASSYLLVSTDNGTMITVTVTATNTGGSTGVTSAGVGPITVMWTPANLTGLIGWWDTSVTASLSLTGSQVNSIADQSGLGNTANWFNAKPVYSATGFNTSYPAIIIQPRAVAGLLRVSSGFPMGTGNTLTCWYVATFGGDVFFGTNNGRILSYAAPSQSDFNNLNSWCVNRNGNSNTQINFTRNSTASLATYTATSPHRFITTIDSSGVQTIYVNGTATTGSTVAGNWLSAGSFAIGADAGAGSFWDGPIAECGVATGYSDATTAAQLDNYLKTKWGL